MRISDVNLYFLGHDGFLIEYLDKRIFIDPFKLSNNDKIGKADLILITHSHYDHCSIEDISKIIKEGTEIVIPVDCQSKLNRLENVKIRIATTGIKMKVLDINVYPFPAYNIGKKFHPKDENWMGFILKFGDVIIYHAGDTDKIPEMDFLPNLAQEGEKVVAILPVSGVYVMDSKEAAEAALIIKPYLAVPMHYNSGVVKNGEDEIYDAKKFVSLCKDNGINAKILKKI